MSSILSDTDKAVIETIRMRLSTEQSLQYMKDNGLSVSRSTYFRHKKKLEKKKLERLYHIANIGFEDQHLQRLDGLELIEKKMWEEYNKEEEPWKRVKILKDIAQVQPYLSSYYEATKYVIDKDKCKKRFSGKIVEITQIQETNDIDEAIINEIKENRMREAEETY